MDLEQAQAELMILRGLASSGYDLALVKERIDRLYWAVCRKHVRTCKCKDKYKDALMEIYAKLKSNETMAEKTLNTQARLVSGVVLFVDGNHYTNKNLTDDVARQFLAKFPHRKDWFASLPSATTEKAVVAEVEEHPEKGAEIAPKAVKTQSKPTTPRKKKNTAKRK